MSVLHEVTNTTTVCAEEGQDLENEQVELCTRGVPSAES